MEIAAEKLLEGGGLAFWVLMGMAWGSFLAQVADRLRCVRAGKAMLPGWDRRLSLGYPRRSVCLECGLRLRWWQNLPLLAYLVLRGRCACPRRVPLARHLFWVEALAAAGFASIGLLCLHFSLSLPEQALVLILTCALSLMGLFAWHALGSKGSKGEVPP